MSPAQITIIIVVVAIIVFLLSVLRKKMSSNDGYQRELIRDRQREQVALLSIADAVITTDETGQVDYMNATAERLTEWDFNVARGHSVQSIFRITDIETPTLMLDPVSQCLKEGQIVRLVKPVNLSGRLVSKSVIEATVSPIRNRSGKIIGTVLVFHDISKVRELQDHINYQSSHDPLTGLLHRQEFEKHLDEALRTAHRDGSHHALCYMDIDQFKIVNENYGHIAGDELLIQLSVLLRSAVRGEDTLARLGGDEFAVLLKDCSLEEAVSKARSIMSIIEECSFVWNGKAIDVGLAFSIVAISSASGSSNEVFKAAESACYTAKTKGRNQLVIYQSSDPELIKRRGEMRWASRIREALRNQEFQLYYQSILPIQEGNHEGVHYELLMRTESTNHGLVSPEDFIPAAERYNLMGDIDRWVVSAAIKNIAKLEKVVQADRQSTYGINLSGQSLGDNSFIGYVSDLFDEHDVDPGVICFEVTETSAIINEEIALDIIRKLKKLGCKFALDDFGTGVSSYSYLKSYPFDYVKIDGSFIQNILTNPVDAVMVESVCRIAQVMGIKTIAEFVEEKSVIDKLREIGVDFAQGYGIAKPAPLLEWINEQASSEADSFGNLAN